jgi:ribosomal protein S18 acetylase RimI-like enzyme
VLTEPRPAAGPSRRTASDSDAPLLRLLFEESRPDLAVVPAETRAAILDLQLRAQHRQQDADHPGCRREIVVSEGAPVGLLVSDRDSGAVHVLDIAIAVDHRGRGVGSTVLTELIEEARGSDREVTLQVWADNTGARRLYERLGFAYVDPATDTGHLRMRWRPDPITRDAP